MLSRTGRKQVNWNSGAAARAAGLDRDGTDPASISAKLMFRSKHFSGPLRTVLIAAASAISALLAIGAAAAYSFLSQGLYQVEVRISLPNVQNAAAPVIVTKCVTPDDLKSGHAFSVLSDNPLRNCDLFDYQLIDGTATYRIACPGPNKGSAVAVFQTTATAYRGSIKMNMGGKNMTMSETQVGKRIGDCP